MKQDLLLPSVHVVIDFLEQFAPLSQGLVKHLEQALQYRELRKGDLLLKRDHVCRDIHFVEAGLLRSFYKDRDEDSCSWFMYEGDVVISVHSFYKQIPGNEWIEALEDCRLWYIKL